MNEVRVTELTSYIGGPFTPKYTLDDGDRMIATTSPGCWGPMITPRLLSGHEVTCPVYINGAEPGDAIAIEIEKIRVISQAAISGTEKSNPTYFDGDPTVYSKCPHCDIHNPETHLEGIGGDAVRCTRCGRPVTPNEMDNGYTVAISEDTTLGVAVDPQSARQIALKTLQNEYAIAPGSKQHLATILGKADFEGLPIRSFPMVGNIGCSPARPMPASKNAGDCYHTVKNSPVFEQPSREEITDAHMDISLVGENCIILSPVLVEGAGLHFGDVHFTQGAGELARHTLDITAEVVLRVRLLKNLRLQGPVIIPDADELNPRFRPFSKQEYEKSREILSRYQADLKEKSYPILVVGTGPNLNEAIDNAVERAAELTQLLPGEILNRATVGGDVGIGRTSGCVYLTLTLGEGTLKEMGLLDMVKNHYERP